jgi:hypothetical protein
MRTAYCRQHNLKFHTFVYQIKTRQRAQAAPVTLVPMKVRAAPTGCALVLHGPKG